MAATCAGPVRRLDALGIAATTIDHPAGLHRRGSAGACAATFPAPHQEPLPQGQEGRSSSWSSARRTRRDRPEAPAQRGSAPRAGSPSASPSSCMERSASSPARSPPSASSTTRPAASPSILDAGADGRRTGSTATRSCNTRPPRSSRRGPPRLHPRHRPRAANPGCVGRLTADDCKSRPDRAILRREWTASGISRMIATGPVHEAMSADARQPPAAPGDDLDQGHDTQTFCQDVIETSRQLAGAGRFLGALVRPLQAADPDPREGRARRQGHSAPGQDEHRRPSGRSPASSASSRSPRSSPSQRPAGRRLHGRAAGEPGQGLHRPPRRAARAVARPKS